LEAITNRNLISLAGVDKNAFRILAFVRREMRKAGYNMDKIEEYTRWAKAREYTNLLLRVSTQQVDALNEPTGAYDDTDEATDI
jgi:hypothetical protein